jgi:hypothetical protein
MRLRANGFNLCTRVLVDLATDGLRFRNLIGSIVQRQKLARLLFLVLIDPLSSV